MKKIKKLLLRLFIVTGVGVLLLVSYFEFGGYFLLGEGRERLGAEINAATSLPDNVLKIYDVIYPDALHTGIWKRMIVNAQDPCPCRMATYYYRSHYIYGNFFCDVALNSFQIEDMATQAQCLNYIAGRTDFLNGNIGIESAAKYHYNKKLSELSEDEIFELLVMMKNPSLYNKQRRPELISKEVEKLKTQLKNSRDEQ